MKTFFSLLLAFFTLTYASAQSNINTVEEQKDVVYATVGNWQGKLDLYLPRENDNPLLIYIHGGGWVHGKKEEEYEKIKVFIENGFAVANVEYRLANQAPAPAAVIDVNCAIAYLLKNASKFRFDKRKVVLMGASAGAHLALLAGLQSNLPLYQQNCLLKNFKPAAIISKYGPTDLLTWEAVTKSGGASSAWLGNRLTDTVFIKTLSPVNYVSKQKTPVLLIHGDQDKTVPIAQSKLLYEKLKRNGNPTELYIVANGKHGNFGPVETPKMDVKMLEFLAKYVR